MSVTGYYGCDCDKYNPDCRCYPRKEEPVATEMSDEAARILACEQEARDTEAKWATLRAVILNGCREPDEAGEVGLHVATVAVAEAIRLGLASAPAALVVTDAEVDAAWERWRKYDFESPRDALRSILEAAFAAVKGDDDGK